MASIQAFANEVATILIGDPLVVWIDIRCRCLDPVKAEVLLFSRRLDDDSTRESRSVIAIRSVDQRLGRWSVFHDWLSF
jgi:hypothetical protein